MRADRRNLAIGVVTLVALLAAFIGPNFRQGAASLSHPDPVGPTAYSKSAIGHLAFRRLLDEVGIATSISESGSGGYVGADDLLIVAEPRHDAATLADVRAMLTARNVLLVLPKRTGRPDPSRPYWLADDKMLADDSVEHVLSLADNTAKLVRGGSLEGLTGSSELAGAVSIDKPQLIRSHALHPLLASADGILIGERRTRTGRIVVLSDPDLIANFNLIHGDNSVLAVSLVEYLRADHSEGRVIFDEFAHGFSEKPFHLLGILFQFPFVLVTGQMGVATLLLVWAAMGRFGAPVSLAIPLEAGKRSLIDNATRLLAQSGRIPDLSERYFEEMVRDTGRRLRAPSGLDLAALLAWLARAPGSPRRRQAPRRRSISGNGGRSYLVNLEHTRSLTEEIKGEVRKVIVGQDGAIGMMLTSLLAGGHVLLEGVPGTAKTLLAQAFATTLSLRFGRIQFTPDLMPGDVLGTNLFNFQTNEFILTKGPIFTEVLLADEINRTPPKTQAALLQAMNERTVTIDATNHSLGEAFMVIATQNPIEQQGTYPLPEAQLDRFLFKLVIEYPERDAELEIVRRHGHRSVLPRLEEFGLRAVAGLEAVKEMRAAVASITLSDEVIAYIVDIVRATRGHPSIEFGASPRAATMLATASRAHAVIQGRDFVIPDDVKMLVLPTLRHRVTPTARADIEGVGTTRILADLLERIPAPR